MEVFMSSAFGIEVSPPSAAAYVSPENNYKSVGSGRLIGAREDDLSDSSSSIGAPDDSDEEEGEEVSKTAFNSLDSLEESLPIKRGLSNHFAGKSKSFASLADVVTSSSSVTVKDLEKPENPFNKRRRLIMANKWSRKSFYSWSNPKSMPLLALNEEDEQQQLNPQRNEEDEDEEDKQVSQASPCSSSSEFEMLKNQPRFSKLEERKFKKSFKSQSCFSLSDLQHQEEFQ